MNVCKVWEVGEESRPSTSVKATYTCTMCKMAHFARNAVSSDDLKVVLKSANLGDLRRAGNSGR